MDSLAKVRVWAKVDEVVQMIAENLGIEIPEFKLQRHAKVFYKDNQLQAAGIDIADESPYDIFREVKSDKNQL